ncbi:MAG TPA: chemotaxis protein CheD [Syntrophorhabdaceae bacterium]|nr:chemotaxis protein CheD [Syntrophorhabdaceae bacterium]
MNIFLKPGEIYISDKPEIVTTILGSCVALTIFSKRLRVGGICHAQLPINPSPSGDDPFRYVDSSLLYMLKKIEIMGISKGEMEIKLIGGADVLDRTHTNSSTVGQKNIETALSLIQGQGLSLAASHVGGELGRKIHFHVHTGRILLKRITRISNEETRTVNTRFRTLTKQRNRNASPEHNYFTNITETP